MFHNNNNNSIRIEDRQDGSTSSSDRRQNSNGSIQRSNGSISIEDKQQRLDALSELVRVCRAFAGLWKIDDEKLIQMQESSSGTHQILNSADSVLYDR